MNTPATQDESLLLGQLRFHGSTLCDLSINPDGDLRDCQSDSVKGDCALYRLSSWDKMLLFLKRPKYPASTILTWNIGYTSQIRLDGVKVANSHSKYVVLVHDGSCFWVYSDSRDFCRIDGHQLGPEVENHLLPSVGSISIEIDGGFQFTWIGLEATADISGNPPIWNGSHVQSTQASQEEPDHQSLTQVKCFAQGPRLSTLLKYSTCGLPSTQASQEESDHQGLTQVKCFAQGPCLSTLLKYSTCGLPSTQTSQEEPDQSLTQLGMPELQDSQEKMAAGILCNNLPSDYLAQGLISKRRNGTYINMVKDPASGTCFVVKTINGCSDGICRALKLKHSNIIKTLSIIKGSVSICIMEHVENCRDLSQYSNKKAYTTISPDQAYQILKEQASALSYLHNQKLVHCDFKPSNVILSPQGSKLIDFDLCTLVGSPWPGGTPGFLPRDCKPPFYGQTECRLDIYAFGITAYWLMGAMPTITHYWLLHDKKHLERHEKAYAEYEKHHQVFKAPNDYHWISPLLWSICYSKEHIDADAIYKILDSPRNLEADSVAETKGVLGHKHSRSPSPGSGDVAVYVKPESKRQKGDKL